VAFSSPGEEGHQTLAVEPVERPPLLSLRAAA
jgi:hypothetical protein